MSSYHHKCILGSCSYPPELREKHTLWKRNQLTACNLQVLYHPRAAHLSFACLIQVTVDTQTVKEDEGMLCRPLSFVVVCHTELLKQQINTILITLNTQKHTSCIIIVVLLITDACNLSLASLRSVICRYVINDYLTSLLCTQLLPPTLVVVRIDDMNIRF